jgi:flagellar hook-associated protein 1 FlgK
LETSLWNTTSTDAYNQNYYEILSQVEDVLSSEEESPLDNAMLEFANDVQALATYPEDSTTREALLGSAETLASVFNMQYGNLESIRDYIAENDSSGDGAIQNSCDSLNTLLDNVVALNKRIANLEGDMNLDDSANSLRDERDDLITQISEYIDVSVTENSDGTYTVDLNLDGGTTATLIDGTAGTAADHLAMSMVESPASSGFYEPQMELASAAGTAISLESGSGSIQALVDAREYITTEMTSLYNYANSFASAVNALQNSATTYDLNGNNNAGDLFTVSATQPTSGDIISVALTDGDSLAASTDADQQGNGDNAQAIWNKLDEDNTIDSDSYLSHASNMLTSIALDVSQASDEADNSAAMKELYQNAILELCGVDTDEEMAHLLEVQRTYQAAAKIINAVDEMMQTVINMI